MNRPLRKRHTSPFFSVSLANANLLFSYYGDSADPTINRRYLSQIRERAADVARRYPGWTMRVYYDGAEDDLDAVSEMCDIWCAADHVDFCDVNALPRPFGNLKSLMPVGELVGRNVILALEAKEFFLSAVNLVKFSIIKSC